MTQRPLRILTPPGFRVRTVVLTLEAEPDTTIETTGELVEERIQATGLAKVLPLAARATRSA